MPTTILTDLAETKLGAAAGNETAVEIKYVALGRGRSRGNYDPTHEQNALEDEFIRREVDTQYPYDTEQNGWLVMVTFPADETPQELVREIGFFDTEGDLIAIWAGLDIQARQVGVIDYPARHFLSFKRVAGGLIKVEADLDFRMAVEADLSGVHDPDGQFNFALTRSLKDHMYTSMENFEALAQVRRGYGQSGVRMGRHYAFGGDAPYHRPSVVNFSAFGVHDHANYPLMCGMPEITAIVNGYEVNTRHIDYRIVQPLAGAYLEVDDPQAPAAPTSVTGQATPAAQVAEMREYLRAFALKDTSIRDYRPHFDVYLSAIECWLEVLDGDDLVDTFPSFRHQLSKLGHKRMNDDYMALVASGLKSRFENDDFKPTVIRVMRPDGSPQFGVLRYRVSAVRLGDYGQWPVHQMVSAVDDPVTRARKRYEIGGMAGTRLERFRVNRAMGDDSISERYGPGLLDDIMGMLPGLDGLGSVLHEEYEDTDSAYRAFTQRLLEYHTTERMNSAFYRRFYSYEVPGAAGRQHYRFGYNDPTLFRAATSRPEVVALPGMGGGHRLSWAIPLELLVVSPLAGWNPYGVAETTQALVGTGAQATPYEAIHKNGYWYQTPTEVFDGPGGVPDPADTGLTAWVLDSGGTPRLMRASGMHIHMPAIADTPPARLRYPIAPVHHEGSFEFGYATAVQQETRDALAVMADQITNMKHNARHET